MPNELGALIHAEVGRAEADLSGLRSRGQSVLTTSGALVTVLAAVIALAVGKDPTFSFSGLTKWTAVVALLSFVGATTFVLWMNLPAGVDAPSSKELADFAETHWDAETWEQDVAVVMSTYLISLREANQSVVVLLRLAISTEVLGIAAVAIMAISLIAQVD